jgi:hypothetical protein
MIGHTQHLLAHSNRPHAVFTRRAVPVTSVGPVMRFAFGSIFTSSRMAKHIATKLPGKYPNRGQSEKSDAF